MATATKPRATSASDKFETRVVLVAAGAVQKDDGRSPGISRARPQENARHALPFLRGKREVLAHDGWVAGPDLDVRRQRHVRAVNQPQERVARAQGLERGGVRDRGRDTGDGPE